MLEIISLQKRIIYHESISWRINIVQLRSNGSTFMFEQKKLFFYSNKIKNRQLSTQQIEQQLCSIV